MNWWFFFIVEIRLKQRIRALMTYRSHGLKRLHHIRIYERLKSQRKDMKKKRQAFDHCVRNLQVIRAILHSVNCFYWFRVYWVFVYCFYCILLVLLEILSLAWAHNIPTNCIVTMYGWYLIMPLMYFCSAVVFSNPFFNHTVHMISPLSLELSYFICD